MLCVIDVCHEDVRVETMCEIVCLFRGFCSSGYAHPYPLWAVCREVAEVVVIEVVVLVMQCCADSAV